MMYQGFLRRQNFAYRAFTPTDATDHEHCNFCGAKFSSDARDMRYGYASEDGIGWVCPVCFEQNRADYQWDTPAIDAKMNARALLSALTARYRAILADSFVGLYVHGSLAMGCFNPRKSDIDYIIVCREEPSDEIKHQIMISTLEYAPFAPKKGLEMHLMRKADTLVYRDPPYFCLHSSPMHEKRYCKDPIAYIASMKGEDPDLAAHLTVIGARGICQAGEPIADVFGPVPPSAYLKSVLDDAEWQPELTMYHILNNLRILAYLQDGSVLSKREGGEWGLANMDKKDAAVIREALACYASDREMTPTPEADAFCARTLRAIKARAERR